MRRRSAGSAARCKATDAGAGDHRQLAHRDPVELPIPHAGYQAAEPWRRGRDGEDARHRSPPRADGPRPELLPPSVRTSADRGRRDAVPRWWHRPLSSARRNVRRLVPGIWGDPSLATRAQGEKVYALITDWIAQIVEREWAESGPARAAARPREWRRGGKG